MGNVPSSLLSEIDVDNNETTLPDVICASVEFINTTDKEISVIQYDNGVAGPAYVMPVNTTYIVSGILNLNEVTVANGTDSSTVTVPYRYYSYNIMQP